MSNDNRTRSQRHAEKALACINAIKGEKDLRDDYKSRADGFPVMVMQAGLAQALGFMQAKQKDKPAYGRYLDDLAGVLGKADGQALLACAIAAERPEYRQMTREVLAIAGWFKRFGQAYLSEKQEKKHD